MIIFSTPRPLAFQSILALMCSPPKSRFQAANISVRFLKGFFKPMVYIGVFFFFSLQSLPVFMVAAISQGVQVS